jgi:hypothetical protein
VDYSENAPDERKTIGELLRFDGELVSDVIKNFVDYMIESYIKGHYIYEFNQVGKKWLEYYEKIIKIYKEKVINIFHLSGYEQKYNYLSVDNTPIGDISIAFFDASLQKISNRRLSVTRDLVENINEQLYMLVMDAGEIEYKYLLIEYLTNHGGLLDCSLYELDDSFDTLPQTIKYHTQEFKKRI